MDRLKAKIESRLDFVHEAIDECSDYPELIKVYDIRAETLEWVLGLIDDLSVYSEV